MKVIIDEYNLQTYQDAFLVNDDYSYVEARKLILENKIDGEINKTIIISSHPYTSWFSDIENESYFSVERVLPSKKLSEKYVNVEIDKDLREKDIIDLSLLNQAFEPTEISIVNAFIGGFFLNVSDLKEQLYEITAFASNPSKLFSTSKYLLLKWSKYLDKIESKTPLIQSLIVKLKDADLQFSKIVNYLIYVSNSQLLLREYIHDNKSYLETTLHQSSNDLAIFLLGSRINVPFNEQYELRMEKFYKTLYKDDITLFFSEKSDYKASIRAYLSIVTSISNDEKENIYSKYKRVIDLELDDKLRLLVKPEISPPPNLINLSLASQVKEWHNWAVNTFIPFKFYLDEFPNEDDIKLVEEYANAYSDWLVNNYLDILQSGLKTNFNLVELITNELTTSRVIWLIIDGFPSSYTESLKSILKSNGINKIHVDYHFAALPTITEIGIPTQLSGRFPESEDFTTNRVDALKQAFKSHKVIFCNSIKLFGEVMESDYDICCLHWKEIDELMHKEDNAIDKRRIDEVKRLLEIKIKQVTNVLKANSGKSIKLVISTDHGATKCLTRDQSIKNSTLIEACRDNPKERCMEITGKVVKANIDSNEIYYLKSEQTHNSNDWIVAKGYRYFGRFDYGYRHGGLTPEETIIPLLIGDIVQNERIPLKIIYGGLTDLKIGFTENLKFSVTNDNDVAIDVFEITISEDPNFIINLSQKIDAESSKTFEGKIKLAKTVKVTEGKTILNITISYALRGEKFADANIIKVPIKKSLNEGLESIFN